ncbi:hypothetical protein ACQP3L_35140, partial [Escherichia coli]
GFPRRINTVGEVRPPTKFVAAIRGTVSLEYKAGKKTGIFRGSYLPLLPPAIYEFIHYDVHNWNNETPEERKAPLPVPC